MTTKKLIIISVFLISIVLLVGMAWLLWGGISNPAARHHISEISAPVGFERMAVEKDSFGAFIRNYPLQKRGSHIKYYNGSIAYGQYFGYAVLDLPMISEIEQCADAVMRMRAEYLWSRGLYNEIHFHSVSGEDQRYNGENNRNSFEKYLRSVYGKSNTASLRHELKKKEISKVSPGDVLVYESPRPGRYGHAVLVVDVAHNTKTGQTAIMLAQSSTPALTMHIIRDILHPFRSPWIILDENSERIFISGISFDKSDLRAW